MVTWKPESWGARFPRAMRSRRGLARCKICKLKYNIEHFIPLTNGYICKFCFKQSRGTNEQGIV